VAASHGGSLSSVLRLLDAGAELKPPAGARVRRSALVAASMAGDVDNVRLLLSRGAAPSAEALSEAITFGRTSVVRMLIGAGADVDGTDGAGINLLHWAVITNRPAVIPLLAKAGVPVNEPDQSGFTPLMYAATIDFGDTASLDALLAAGAKRSIRNNDGRTPLQQARYFQHAALAAKLAR
jgi:serine/threonine-protein phosphatase 6 regulatory ankyrin repeat subunit B